MMREGSGTTGLHEGGRYIRTHTLQLVTGAGHGQLVRGIDGHIPINFSNFPNNTNYLSHSYPNILYYFQLVSAIGVP